MRQNPHLLQLKNLSVDYSTVKGTLHALKDITFTVDKGQIIGVVGESGCGKSTLISAIIGLTDPNANLTGQIQFKDQSLLECNSKQWRDIRGKDISVIFQDPMLAHNPVLTIEKQLFDIQYRSKLSKKEKRQMSINMLNKVGISDAELRLKQYPHEFSGGMRQRISIAMALMSKPSLLIADEPTTALDATLEVQILELLKTLQKEINCSVLFISHHLGVIAELCDKVMVMYAGELVEHGKTRDIFENPMHPYTKALIECDPGNIAEKTKTLPTIKGEVPQLIGSKSCCIFEERCSVSKSICQSITPKTIEINGHYGKCHLLS